MNLRAWTLNLGYWGSWGLVWGLGWGLAWGFGHGDLAGCGPWGLGLRAWGMGWGLDSGFGLVFALVDLTKWDLGLWILNLGH